jgi:hypothetical protein
MPGPRTSAQRAKTGKNIKSSSKKKRMKNDSEKQAAYKAKLALRRSKKLKK